MAVRRKKKTEENVDEFDTPLSNLQKVNAPDAGIRYHTIQIQRERVAHSKRNKTGRRPALVIWDLPIDLRRKFRAACEDHSAAMKDVIYLLMLAFVTGRVTVDMLNPSKDD